MRPTLPLPPHFSFGITGKMDLSDACQEHQDAIRKAIRYTMEQLSVSKRDDEEHRQKQPTTPLTGFELAVKRDLPRLGLLSGRRVLMSSMAPGADTLAAEAAAELGIPVIGCLPFPADLYPELTTFVWDRHRIPRKAGVDECNNQRQATIRSWLKDKLADQFCVRLAEERREGVSEDQLAKRLKVHLAADAPTNEEERQKLSRERRLRYRAAGEYVAVQSHIMIAVMPYAIERTAADAGKTSETNGPLPDPQVAPDPNADGHQVPYEQHHDPAAKHHTAADMLAPVMLDIITGKRGDVDIDAGSDAIVRIRRDGITPGVLVSDPAFQWTSTGLTIVIRYPAAWHSGESKPGSIDECLNLLQLEVIYPTDAAPESAYAWNQFIRLVGNMVEFQRMTTAPNIDPNCGSEDRVEWLISRKGPFFNMPLRDESGLTENHKKNSVVRKLLAERRGFSGTVRDNWIGRLTSLASCRRHAADESRTLSGQYDSLIRLLFVLTTLAAVLVHVGGHWHTETPTAHAVLQLTQGEVDRTDRQTSGSAHENHPRVELKQESENSTQDHHHSFVGVLWQFFGVLFSLWGISRYVAYQKSSKESRRFDLRALSEGLRIQIYWVLAGLSDSVAASYMQRQRSEVDWFRRCLSSLTAPYDRWSVWFQSLNRREKRDAMEMVTHAFIGEQLSYMTDAYQEHSQQLHYRHVKGYSQAATGLSLLSLSIFMKAIHWNPRPDFGALVAAAFFLATLLIVGLAMMIYGMYRLREQQPETKFLPGETPAANTDTGALDLKEPPHHAHQPWVKANRLEPDNRNTLPSLFEQWKAVGMWWWGQLEHVAEPKVPYGLAIAWLIMRAICICVIIAAAAVEGVVALPGFVVCLSISAGIHLLLGALTLAQGEKRLLSEHRLQYNAMAGMHRAAFRRLLGHLRELDRLFQREETLSTELAAIGTSGDAGADKRGEEIRREIEICHRQADARIAAMQQLIRDAGLQALDENAEWLILHRSRPMEPVMAG